MRDNLKQIRDAMEDDDDMQPSKGRDSGTDSDDMDA